MFATKKLHVKIVLSTYFTLEMNNNNNNKLFI